MMMRCQGSGIMTSDAEYSRWGGRPRSTDLVLRPHRRQFVIGPHPYQPFNDWSCTRMDDALYLSHCPDLRVGWASDGDGTCWALLGIAVQTVKERPDPLTSLSRSSSGDVPRLYSSWAGRWTLTGSGELHLDASGLLGCYYGMDRDGGMWATSSPALIGALTGAETYREPQKLRYESGISWLPPPQSRFQGVRRLLPSQVLHLGNGSVRPRALVPELERRLVFDEAVTELADALTTALALVSKLSELTWLGLTAGADSRTMLAVASAKKAPVCPYTRISPRMSAADLVMPPQLARAVGYDHRFIRAPARPSDRWQLVREHGADHVSRGDVAPLLRGDRDGLLGISLGGHGFSLAKGFADWRRLPAKLTDPESGTQRIAEILMEPADSHALTGIREWLAWVQETPDDRIDWRDRLFIEQRQAGWLSAKEQAYDLLRLERFPILNSARNHALLLGLPESQRLGDRIPTTLMRGLAPALLEYPLNPPDRNFLFVRPAHVMRRSLSRSCRRLLRRAPIIFWQRYLKPSRLAAPRADDNATARGS